MAGRGLRLGRAAIVALFLVSVLAAGGRASGPSPNTYAGVICRAFARWQHQLTVAIGSPLRTNSPQVVKARLVTAFSGAATATDALAHAVQRAGIPNAPQGTAISSEVLKAVRQARTALSAAAQNAKQLPTSTPQAFASGVQNLDVELADATRTPTSTLEQFATQYQSTALGHALATNPSCTQGQ